MTRTNASEPLRIPLFRPLRIPPFHPLYGTYKGEVERNIGNVEQ